MQRLSVHRPSFDILSLPDKAFKKEIHLDKHHFFVLYFILTSKDWVKSGHTYGAIDIILIGISILTNNYSHHDVAKIWRCPEKTISRLFKTFRDGFSNMQDYIINKTITILNKDDGLDEKGCYKEDVDEIYKMFRKYNVNGSIDGSIISISGEGIDTKFKERFIAYKTKRVGLNCLVSINRYGFIDFIDAAFQGVIHDQLTYKIALVLGTLSSIVDNMIDGENCIKLGDAGFTADSNLMVPYKGVRYHLERFGIGHENTEDYTPDQIRQLEPKNRLEIFNFCHARHRVGIENTFGRVKNMVKILRGEIPYTIKSAIQIINCGFAFYNFYKFDEIQLNELVLSVMNEEFPYNDFRYIDQNGGDTDDNSNRGETNEPADAFDAKLIEVENKFKDLIGNQEKVDARKLRIKLSLELEKWYLTEDTSTTEERIKKWNFYDIVPNDSLTGREDIQDFEMILEELDYKAERQRLKELKKSYFDENHEIVQEEELTFEYDTD